jgi:uncharacterized protein (TIGR03382 family)
MISKLSLCAVGALALSALAGGTSAAVIQQGTYDLHNHPDGNERPPLYGLRLDELYNATSNHDIFTFDFDDARSDMNMVITANTIRIFGVVWGGRDTGSAYAVEATTGLYTVDFLFNVGVVQVPGDDDLGVLQSASHQNHGTITSPTNDVIALVDEAMDFPYGFRLGDEDNDQGHRGFAGISGWGWLTHGPDVNAHVASSDWLFTATLVPTPGTSALALTAGAMLLRRRR